VAWAALCLAGIATRGRFVAVESNAAICAVEIGMVVFAGLYLACMYVAIFKRLLKNRELRVFEQLG